MEGQDHLMQFQLIHRERKQHTCLEFQKQSNNINIY